MNTKPEKFSRVLTFLAVVAVCICKLEAQTTSIPASYALPAGAVDTSQPGFLVRPYQTDVTHGGTLAWSEGQLAGLDGPNTADLTGADAQGYLTVLTVVNWNISPGTAVDGFAGADAMPGIGSASTVNFTEEVLTYLNFPAAGTYTLGVNRDDGFGLAVAALNPKDQASAIEVGQRNGTGGAGDTTFSVSVAQAGFYPFRLLFFQLGGLANVSWFSVVTNGATTAQILINDTVAGAIKAYRAVTTASAYAQKVDPGVSANNVLPSEGIHIQMVDGATPLAASSISLVLDNTALTPSITKTGSVTYIDYSLPAPWASQTQHTVSLAFADGALKRTNSWQFTVQNYISLDPAWRVTAVDTNKAGFNWNIFANSDSGRLSPNNGNSNERAESDLRLQAVDSTGATLPNLATPSAVGAAIGAGVAPSAPNSPVHFEIATTLKLDVATLTMPGMPATDSSPNGVAAEVLTYLALPAGVIAMEVDSDNGWRLYAGANPADAFGRNVVAEHNDGTGPVQFSFVVSQSGIYPFRLVWESGTSATPYLDWYSIDKSGNTVLVNDVAHGGVPAYRALVAGTTVAPFVMGVAPVPALHQMEVANTNLTIVIADGSKPVDDNSVTLTVDGKNITPVKKRQGNLLTISDGGAAFPGLQLPSDVHSATLTYKDSSGASTRNQQWTFNNIQILVLPAAPLVQENFDSYPEATSPANTVPPGWTASNFTAVNTTGWDITDKSSDSFKNWILLSATDVTAIEGSALNNDPNQTINGQPVSNFASGNVLWATSDGRSGVQAQFVTSAPINLSTITNPVMIFSSLMRASGAANVQSDGIEYSVDGGTTWLPGIIYVGVANRTEGVVKLLPDGSIDAVQTLTTPYTPLAWVDPSTGQAGGGTMGSGLAEPITQALAPYITIRSDVTATSTKVDGIRLPQASKQKSVKLRFFQMGNCSWWWGVDNLAFYDSAPTTAVSANPPHIDSIQSAGGQITIAWSNGGTLQSTPTLTNPTWTSTGNSSGKFSEAISTSGNKFYRVQQ